MSIRLNEIGDNGACGIEVFCPAGIRRRQVSAGQCGNREIGIREIRLAEIRTG